MVVSLSKGIPKVALHEIVIFRRTLFSAGVLYPATKRLRAVEAGSIATVGP
jgi:hypothetical protein